MTESATKNVKTIQQLLEEGGPRDATATLDRLWAIMSNWREQVLARVELSLDASTDDIRDYSSADGSAQGQVLSYTGPKVDYFVNSWVGNPEMGFTNIHFNLWVSPEWNVPHLGIVFGTVPDLFFYVDYTPRTDMVEHAGDLDRFFADFNDDYLAMREVPGLTEFTSVDPYIRLSKSPVACGFTADLTDENIERFTALGQKYLDQWFAWMDSAEPMPADRVEAVRRRDTAVRREQGRRDPANPIGDRLFGHELSRRLLHGLWGMDVLA
jgi:hypothetical protein